MLQPAADPRARETIVLDGAAETPMPRLAETHRGNSQQHPQGTSPGHGLQQQQNQQPWPASSHAGQQPRPLPRFGPDYSAASGFSPGFRATPSARPAHSIGTSFRSPSQLRSGLGAAAVGTARGSLSAEPKSKLLDQLFKDLSMHKPYDPHAPLPLASAIQQSSLSTSTQIDLDVDAVIARYALISHKCHVSMPYRSLLPGCKVV